MDLRNLQSTERAVEILSPGKKEPIGVRVHLLHIDDPKLKKIRRQIQDEKSRLESRGKYFKSDDLEQNNFALGFAAMTGWEWYNPTGGEKDKGYDAEEHANWKGDKNPPFTKKIAYEIFETLPWFLDQIGSEVSDSESFFLR